MNHLGFSAHTPIHRRSLLLGASAAGLVLLLGAPERALATDALQEAIRRAIGDATPLEGKLIRLELPALAENGATVPFTITVDSPMTEENHVASIHIFAPKNPVVHVADFFFTPLSGRASVTSRMRLAESQEVVGVAVQSDGRAFLARKFVKVTIGGCDV